MNLDIKRHSLSHVLAQSVKIHFPHARLAIWPATEDGFYYDFDFEGCDFSEECIKKFSKTMRKIIKQKQDFVHVELSYPQAREILSLMWEDFKIELVDKFEQKDFKNSEKLSDDKVWFALNIWYWGSQNQKVQDFLEDSWLFSFSDKNLQFIDMCAGWHVENTSELDANSFKISRIAWAYWLWDIKNKQLTRIYAYAFDTKEDLNEHLNMIEEAKKRDHRILWRKLKLFTISDIIWAWLPLLQPAWMLLRSSIENFLRELHKDKWYTRVWTPHIAKKSLYETSGHASKFGDDLFRVKWKEDEFILKPMNCPHHMQIFADNQFSYKDMPVRYFEPATVYRDEKSWQLWWLTRVRAITQDDWHLFCRISQVEEEVTTITNIIKHFYDTMWMTDDYRVSLSVRWEDKSWFLGSDEIWEKAELALESASKKNNLPYKRVEWEAAFYWPKLDFMFKDAIWRQRQLATIQCDFNLPERFKLEFTNENWEQERPVVIHRAICWSLERAMWVLIEHFAWVFPLWLAPRQIIIIPVWEKFEDYARSVNEKFLKAWFRTEIDQSNDSFSKKIRNAEKMHINYILVVWEKEKTAQTLAVRNYRNKSQTEESVQDFIDRLTVEVKNRELGF